VSFISYIFPYEKLSLESRLQQNDIMTRMQWLMQQSSGIPGSGGIRGYFTGPNMFVLETSYIQFGGVVNGNQTSLVARMKPGKKTLFFVLLGLGLMSALIVPLSEPGKWQESPMVFGGIAILYSVYVIIMKKQIQVVRNYLVKLLESRVNFL
jgi:hypothetical protein